MCLNNKYLLNKRLNKSPKPYISYNNEMLNYSMEVPVGVLKRLLKYPYCSDNVYQRILTLVF